MAPERVYIGILFAITLHCACFQGTEGNNETKFISGGSRSGVSLDPSPQTYRIYLQKRTPLLLNCSFTVTDPSLIIKDYTWYLINSDPESEEAYDISNGQDKFFNSKVEQLQNGSLLFKSGYGGRKKGKQLEGDYECFVNTNRKEFLARRVNVTLAAMAKNFSIHPAPVSVALGGVARLSCSIKATPPTDYVWFKDKTQMLDGDRVTILSLGVLQIQDVTSSDVGSYACHTRSSLQDFRTKKSARAELTISTGMSSRPYFLARPQNITVAGGARAELECLVGGAPRPTVTWTKLGSDKKWRGNDPSLTGLSNLVFPSASYYEHNGQYKCSFTSQQGKQESTVFLTVVEPPVISKGLESLTLPVSKNQRFRVAFNLEPSSVGLNWAWMLQGWDIEDDGGEHKDLNFNLFTGGTELFIEHLQEKNTGFLQYIVQNDAGISISTAFLNVTKKPNAPDQTMNLTGIALDSKTIFLTWEHMHTLKKPETRPYVVKFHIVGTDNFYQTICANINMASPHQNCTLKASITNIFLQPGTNYSISVTAYNVHGGGDSSDNVYVKTLEGGYTIPDQSRSSRRCRRLWITGGECLMWHAMQATEPRSKHPNQKLKRGRRFQFEHVKRGVTSSRVQLDCPARSKMRAFRPTSFVWRKDGVRVDDLTMKRDTMKQRRHKLIIQDLKLSDSGNYTCVVGNDVSTLTWWYTLQVEEPRQGMKNGKWRNAQNAIRKAGRRRKLRQLEAKLDRLKTSQLERVAPLVYLNKIQALMRRLRSWAGRRHY